MRLLVTGGAGTLGRDLVQRSLTDPAVSNVAVLDSFARASRESLPQSSRMSIYEVSVVDAASVDQVFTDFQPDVVVHAAASYASPGDWEGDVHTNVLGTINVVRAAERSQASRLVYFQTMLCYGEPESLPVTEDHALRPTGSYPISKVAGEEYALECAVPTVSLRIASVLSLGLSIGPIPAFYQRLKRDEPCRVTDVVRDFLDPDDFFALLQRAMDPGSPTGVFNAASGEGHSVLELFNKVANHLGSEAEPEVVSKPQRGDISALVLDPTKAQAAFDWKPEIPFDQSLRGLLEWYDRHGTSERIFSHHAAGDEE